MGQIIEKREKQMKHIFSVIEVFPIRGGKTVRRPYAKSDNCDTVHSHVDGIKRRKKSHLKISIFTGKTRETRHIA